MRTKPDELLWADFVSGNDESYRVIYVSYIQSLYNYGCHFTADEHLIQDCIQDLFIDLYNYRSRLNKTDNIKIYLFVSLKRKILKYLESEKKRNSLKSDEFSFEYSLLSENSDESELKEVRIQYLEKAMKSLSARQKEAIYLKYVAGLSYEELCNVLSMNYQAARNLVYRGMEKLRESCTKNSLLLWSTIINKILLKKNRK